MVFFETFLKKKKSESVVLIDIGAGSVGGACAYYAQDSLPSILYSKRLPIEVRKEETREKAMFRALLMLCDDLIHEGSPVLLRAAGNGHPDMILVSIDAPWQETHLRTESFEKKESFLFTKSMVTNAVEQTRAEHHKKTITDESIIGTILNGYETHEPYGKRVHRASVVILTSLIDKAIADGIIAVIRGAYHTRRILPISDSSLRYQAVEKAFPHESDMFIVDATEPMTSLSLIRKHLFVNMVDIPTITGSPEWVQNITSEFSKIAEQYPLPRTIFLLAQEVDRVSLQKKFVSANLGKLWLSDNPPTVVAVLPSHLNDSIRQVTTAPPDLPLLLMALYYQHRESVV